MSIDTAIMVEDLKAFCVYDTYFIHPWCMKKIHFQFYFFAFWSIWVSILSIIAWKAPASSWSTSELAVLLKIDPQCFGQFAKFQDTKGILCRKAVFPVRLSFRFLWLWLQRGNFYKKYGENMERTLPRLFFIS